MRRKGLHTLFAPHVTPIKAQVSALLSIDILTQSQVDGILPTDRRLSVVCHSYYSSTLPKSTALPTVAPSENMACMVHDSIAIQQGA